MAICERDACPRSHKIAGAASIPGYKLRKPLRETPDDAHSESLFCPY
ncbi:hypothetical protein ECEC1736_2112 [Escherichia coli EC1736]|nr:hypothetical protein ECFDA505_4619 [Escherichia coli FDA505]EIN61567.1 hypothetical protein ECPA5_2140 [Escherichia coli PA5]EKI65866.1 hypothetical protein ECEC1736_2112 [Escherichia coli EC1736]